LMALVLTKSLGGLLCLLLALTLYFFLLKEKRRDKIFLSLGGVLTVTGMIFLLRMTHATNHTHPFFSTTMRLDYWRQAIEVIKSSPLTGVGLGNFNLPLSRYAHNSYLQIWAEMGILGIASFLWLILVIFKGAILRLKNSPELKQNAALLAACAAFLAHNFIDFSFFLPEVSLIWWILLGMLL
ncbi:MAG: O-antigen ligase family protein, partial [Candidatus Omnitrophica bacterium]|nr:O-antigen ligase family protein [Candidatus Omnitrophota bacterium]